ncbi:hypothetical protein DESUT3_19440 [Desulfuromonas versatilis]|uniref:Uncharacterized protein n=1 Tax=Desulfuromonas versatilis TaxID=2802975 RepID=A0ABM8HVZ3_9BACT|nr:hypothetical protein [Desulfuromonas versatilis]BCR04875.1 hypothetical protein DESUT3_19440 [Desulfuromonas versatilis]
MRQLLTIVVALLALVAVACAGSMNAPPDAPYKKVSDLVPLPEFLPGMGSLYVQPATLPVGPFLAYDREGMLVSTIYMVPMEEMQQHKNFTGLAVGSDQVKKVDLTYNAGHPGVEAPHYHVTIWHVDPATAKVK